MSNVTAADAWTTVVNVFGDVVYVDIQNAVSLHNTYCFNLNLDSAGPKKIVFRIRQQVTNDSDTESEAESVGSEMKIEDGGNDAEIKTEDTEGEHAAIGPEFQPVIASSCDLLTRRIGNPKPDPANPTAPWSYYVKRAKEMDSSDEE
ncbi:hypothetical protein EDD22DRAFT_962430 [Suillus occidentalis]|nr:hypothetical protein EDD22DRAFT_962430 [Suillus occidentalis]